MMSQRSIGGNPKSFVGIFDHLNKKDVFLAQWLKSVAVVVGDPILVFMFKGEYYTAFLLHIRKLQCFNVK